MKASTSVGVRNVSGFTLVVDSHLCRELSSKLTIQIVQSGFHAIEHSPLLLDLGGEIWKKHHPILLELWRFLLASGLHPSVSYGQPAEPLEEKVLGLVCSL